MQVNAVAKAFYDSTSLSTDRRGHQAARFAMIAGELWEGGQKLAHYSVRQRNQLIEQAFEERGLAKPSVRHIRRLIKKSI
jgi:hypothetical protein